MLSCEETARYLDAYADRELDNRHNLDMEEHLRACPGCRGDLESILVVKKAFQEHLAGAPAPAALRARVEQALRAAPDPGFRLLPQAWRTRPVLRVASPLAALLVLTLGLALYLVNRMEDPISMVYAAAVRGDHEQCWSARWVSFKESDPVKLSEMLYARLGFSVPLNQIVLEGKTLLGGSICPFLGRKGAHILFEDGTHHYSFYVFRREGLIPPSGKSALSTTGRRLMVDDDSRDCVVTWQEGDFYHVMVTDAPPSAAPAAVL